MGELRIRKATPADAPTLLGVFQAAAGAVDSRQMDEAQRTAWAHAMALDDFERLLGSRTKLCWVAEDEDIQGFVALDGSLVHLLYVRPGRQRQGIGTDLLALAERAALTMDIPDLMLRTAPNAVAFYRAHGYKIKSVEATTLAGVPFPRMLMRKSLRG